jgi:hypothetical protein
MPIKLPKQGQTLLICFVNIIFPGNQFSCKTITYFYNKI